MVRRVFFSFHYEEDIWRVNQIRNSWLTRKTSEGPGFWDASLWEDAKTKDESALRAMIDLALAESSVTVVLIGPETAHRKYVRYEIEQSWSRGNGLLGVYIHKLKDARGDVAPKGPNPFARIAIPGSMQPLSAIVATYDWIDDDGYRHLEEWIEEAARVRERTQSRLVSDRQPES